MHLWYRRFGHWLKLSAMAIMTEFPLHGIEHADPTKGEWGFPS